MTEPDALALLERCDPLNRSAFARHTSPDALALVRRRVLRHRSNRRIGMSAAAVATTAAAALLVGVVAWPDSPVGPSTASAAGVLRDAAAAVRELDPVLQLSGQERVYTAEMSTLTSTEKPPRPSVVLIESWTNDGGQLRRFTALSSYAEEHVFPNGMNRTEDQIERNLAADEDRWTRVDGVQSSGEANFDSPLPPTAAQMAQIPTDGAGLEAWAARRVAARTGLIKSGTSGNLGPFNGSYLVPDPSGSKTGVLLGLLTYPLTPPRLRAAALDLLSTQPDLVLRGETTDRLGRRGDLIDMPEPGASPEVRDNEIVIDPASGVLLERRFALSTGTGNEQVQTFVGPTVVPGERALPPGVELRGATEQLRGTILVAPQPSPLRSPGS